MSMQIVLGLVGSKQTAVTLRANPRFPVVAQSHTVLGNISPAEKCHAAAISYISAIINPSSSLDICPSHGQVRAL